MITKITDEVIDRLNRNDVIVYKYKTSSPEYILRNGFEDEEYCYSMGNEFWGYCWYSKEEIIEELNHCLEDGTLEWENDED